MLAEVEQIAYQLAPRYNAAVYSEIGNWRHGLDDLVQDVVAESLLADEQARYLVDTSRTIDEFRCRLELCKLLARLGQPLDAELAAARAVTSSLIDPAPALAQLERLEREPQR